MRIATVSALLLSGLALQAAGPVPRPTKEFTVVLPSGKQTLLSSYRGKVVMAAFMFTTCPHCQAFSKVLTQLNNEYSSRGFQALGVAFDDDDAKGPSLKDKAAAYGREYAGFQVGAANRSTVFAYLGLSELERIGVPQIAVIDRKGVIREQSTSQGGGPLGDPAHLKPLIESLLAEGAPAKGPGKSGDTKKTSDKKTAEKKTSE